MLARWKEMFGMCWFKWKLARIGEISGHSTELFTFCIIELLGVARHCEEDLF